jgi:hypothetical protein
VETRSRRVSVLVVFLAFPGGRDFAFPLDVLRNAHRRTIAKLGFEVYRLRTRMMVLLPPKPPTDTTKTLQAELSLLRTPPRMANSETEVPYRSPVTPAGFQPKLQPYGTVTSASLRTLPTSTRSCA